eukprot:GEZU01020484.1.p2 GENE.GEZU01020484.1~~GEZU01020484.1.p2  ORF type:complete len:153 (-),score=74.56 GEZU01020484.1:24-482(-)
MQSISEKYGTANALAMFNHLKQAGREEGIHFNFPERTPNTFDAHRLMTKAEKVGGLEMQNKLASILFRYYFEEARFIDRAALKQAAEEAQLNIDVDAFLDSDEEKQYVQVTDFNAKARMRINGVPYFIFNNKLTLSGGQPTAVFLKTLGKLR